MEEMLRETYGETVYQEQVMLLSRKLAGFTRSESDKLRKAMGKKDRGGTTRFQAGIVEDVSCQGSAHRVGRTAQIDPTVEDSRFLADGCQLILSSFPADVPVFPVNYDNCHLMNSRNEALCRRTTGEEEG